MTILLRPTRCPRCRRLYRSAAERGLPSGNATLARIELACPCGHVYRLAYRKRPVADDERRAADVRMWRTIRKHWHRGEPERVVAEIALSRMEG